MSRYRKAIHASSCYSLKQAGCFRSICEPFLKAHDFVLCSYSRLYIDGSAFVLTTHPKWVEEFVEKEYVKSCDYIFNLRENRRTNYFLFSGANEAERKVINSLCKGYGVGDGMGIINNFDLYQERFYLAFNPEAGNKSNFFVNNRGIFRDYLSNLLDRANELILDSEKDKFVFDNLSLPMFYDTPVKDLTNPVQRARRFYLTDNIWLSSREYDCCQMWVKGYSGSEMARILGISSKTVYSYIEKVKEKTGLMSRSDMFYLFEKHFGVK